MKEFIPSGAFVEKTMGKIHSYESLKTKKNKYLSLGIFSLLLRTGALSAGFVFAVCNIMRLYFTVFAPVVSH
jgi:hypothetical protein